LRVFFSTSSSSSSSFSTFFSWKTYYDVKKKRKWQRKKKKRKKIGKEANIFHFLFCIVFFLNDNFFSLFPFFLSFFSMPSIPRGHEAFLKKRTGGNKMRWRMKRRKQIKIKSLHSEAFLLFSFLNSTHT